MTTALPAPSAARTGTGIGWRLLLAIVLFSSLVTLTLTGFQLYLDYRGEVREIRDRFDEIEKSYLASLGNSLWSLDSDQIQLQVDGMRHLPDMQYIEVRETGVSRKRQLLISVGERGTGHLISREIPILYAQDWSSGGPQVIGTLYVEASLAGVYRRLADKAITILISQGIKTFLVSAFTLFIVHRLVTRHLISISDFLRSYGPGPRGTAIQLARKRRYGDELDEMTDALNAMSAGLAESITDRERALRELRRQEATLDRAYRHFTTQQTAAKLAHEIRQPLACASTYAQGVQSMMRRGELDPAELPQLVDRMAREVERIREIIAQSQDRLDQPPDALERLSLADVIGDVLPLLHQICDDHGVLAEMAMPDGKAMVRANRTSLQQVAVNLVRNACEAMATRPEGKRTLHLDMVETGTDAGFAVTDTGPGFPADIIRTGHALFASTKQTGSGFGLPIATAILHAHGGMLEISNDEHGGGRVVCLMPKA